MSLVGEQMTVKDREGCEAFGGRRDERGQEHQC